MSLKSIVKSISRSFTTTKKKHEAFNAAVSRSQAVSQKAREFCETIEIECRQRSGVHETVPPSTTTSA